MDIVQGVALAAILWPAVLFASEPSGCAPRAEAHGQESAGAQS